MKARKSVISYLDETAHRIPNNIAVVDADKSYTFLDLLNKSKTVAAYIIQHNYINQNIVILLPKKATAIISFFGCLYSGNTYVPLDYNDAKERLLTIIKKVNTPLVITDTNNEGWLKENGINAVIYESVFDSVDEIQNSKEKIEEKIKKIVDSTYDMQPVYIMHTSGSTGDPKGVVIPHRGVIDFIDWVTKYMKLNEESIIALQSPFHFDASVFDIYSCIAVGAKIVIMPDILATFPAKIPEFIEENKITCIFWVPGILVEVANSGMLEKYKMDSLKMFTFVGEMMPAKQLNMWIKANPNREYINLYGPTEATVACSAYRIKEKFDDTYNIPIGKASLNKRLLIFNQDGKLAEKNEIGEICISGSGLALGYYGEEELTAKAFIQNPLNKNYEEILYRTGDFGYINENDDIVFSGRKDSQIKIHGIRVELGDIENAANNIEGVERACAALNFEKELLLFLQTKLRRQQRQLKQMLKQIIPKYMIPDKIYEIDTFPVNKNGKIDRKELLKIVDQRG